MQPYEILEQRWAEFCGIPHCVAVNSGTSALHLAIEVMQLPQLSTVLVPEFTMIACARAVSMAGHEPRFMDCGKDLLITLNGVKDRWSKRVQAVMPVHIYGRRCDMDGIHHFAQQQRLKVIEDMAEATGIQPDPRTDAACWSFYQNKIVAAEEGGIIAFKDKAHADLARVLRCQGFTDRHDFTHIPRGCNYRMPNSQAKLAINSLGWVNESLDDRRQIEGWYDSQVPDEWKMPPRQVVWVYDLWIPMLRKDQQDWIVKRLNEEGVKARHGFKPCSTQPEYKSFNTGPTALEASRSVIYLPVQPGMKKADADKAVEMLLLAAVECGMVSLTTASQRKQATCQAIPATPTGPTTS